MLILVSSFRLDVMRMHYRCRSIMNGDRNDRFGCAISQVFPCEMDRRRRERVRGRKVVCILLHALHSGQQFVSSVRSFVPHRLIALCLVNEHSIVLIFDKYRTFNIDRFSSLNLMKFGFWTMKFFLCFCFTLFWTSN